MEGALDRVCSARVGAGDGGAAVGRLRGGCGVEAAAQRPAAFSPFVPSIAIAPLRPLQNRRLLGRGAPPATPPLVLRCSPLGALAGLVSGAGGAAGVSPRPASLAGC